MRHSVAIICIVVLACSAIGQAISFGNISLVNLQTGVTYVLLTSDRNALVSHSNGAAIAVTLPQCGSAGFPSGWYYWTQNRGVGTVTITPTTSTVDGAATLALTTNQGAGLFCDGTNYYTMRGIGGGAIDAIRVVFDGGGSTITVGSVGYRRLPVACTAVGWSFVAVGSSPTATIDIWRVATGTALPTVANTIMGTKPALATGNALKSTTLTGWNPTAFSADDILGFNVDAVTASTWMEFTLYCTRN